MNEEVLKFDDSIHVITLKKVSDENHGTYEFSSNLESRFDESTDSYPDVKTLSGLNYIEGLTIWNIELSKKVQFDFGNHDVCDNPNAILNASDYIALLNLESSESNIHIREIATNLQKKVWLAEEKSFNQTNSKN